MQLNRSALNSVALNSAPSVEAAEGLRAANLTSCQVSADLETVKDLGSELLGVCWAGANLRLTNTQEGAASASLTVSSADPRVTKRLAAACSSKCTSAVEAEVEKPLGASLQATLTSLVNLRKTVRLGGEFAASAEGSANLRAVNALRSPTNPVRWVVDSALEVSKDLAASRPGTAVTSGNLRKTVSLGGEFAASAEGSANLRAVNALRSSLNLVSWVAEVDLGGSKNLSSSRAVSAVASAHLQKAAQLEAGVAASAEGSANLRAVNVLRGTASSTLTREADLVATKTVEGSLGAVTTTLATLVRYVELTADTSASTTVTGSAISINALESSFQASIGVIDARLQLLGDLLAFAEAAGGLFAELEVAKTLEAGLASSVTSAGSLEKSSLLSAGSTALTSVQANLQAGKRFEGLARVEATGQASVEVTKGLTGTLVAPLLSTGALKKTAQMAAEAASVAVLAVVASVSKVLSAEPTSAEGSVSANLLSIKLLSASASAKTTSAVDLYWINVLQADPTSSLTAAPTLSVRKGLAGVVAARATGSAGLVRINAAAAAIKSTLSVEPPSAFVVKGLAANIGSRLDHSVELQGTCTLEAAASAGSSALGRLQPIKASAGALGVAATARADLIPVRTLSTQSAATVSASATVHLKKTLSGVSVAVAHCEGNVIRLVPAGLARIAVTVSVPSINSKVDPDTLQTQVGVNQLLSIVRPETLHLSVVVNSLNATAQVDKSSLILAAA